MPFGGGGVQNMQGFTMVFYNTDTRNLFIHCKLISEYTVYLSIHYVFLHTPKIVVLNNF